MISWWLPTKTRKHDMKNWTVGLPFSRSHRDETRQRVLGARRHTSNRRHIRIGALAVMLALGAGSSVAAAGIRSASTYFLSSGSTIQMSGDRIHKDVSYVFTLVNGNARKVFVRGIGRSGPGLELLVPRGSGTTMRLDPPSGPGTTHTVPAHKSIRLTVWFHVSDCSTVPRGSWPLTMDVAWSPGKWNRVGLQMTSGLSVQWQKSLANLVCP